MRSVTGLTKSASPPQEMPPGRIFPHSSGYSFSVPNSLPPIRIHYVPHIPLRALFPRGRPFLACIGPHLGTHRIQFLIFHIRLPRFFPRKVARHFFNAYG